MSAPVYSIVLPFYKQINHAESIYNTYCEHLDRLKESWEIIFVINGPDDGTYNKLTTINTRSNVHVERIERGGWGRAVKYGLSKAAGAYLCYTNTARTDINDLTLILKYALVNDDNVVKATRIIREKWTRKLGSTLYNLECRMLFRVPVWDVNGTPKVLPRKVYKDMKITSEDDLIDAEIIALCVKNKVRIIEIPVIATKRLSGKSTTNYASAFKMYKGLFGLKKNI
ncbi:MAG: glycosyltransferase family 2 protein [Bacteroidia bacterium]